MLELLVHRGVRGRGPGRLLRTRHLTPPLGLLICQVCSYILHFYSSR